MLTEVLKPEIVDRKEGADLIAVLASKTDDKKKTVRLAFRKCLKTMARSSSSEQCCTARSTVFTPNVQKSTRRKSCSGPVVSTHEKSDKD